MRQSQKQKREDMTLRSLEARLRHLPKVEVPQTLETKLLAAIPDRQPKATKENQLKWHPKAWNFGATVAAAVLILALMLMVDYGLSVPSKMLLTELNDTSLSYPGWEQSSFPYDQNNGCVEKTLPCELK